MDVFKAKFITSCTSPSQSPNTKRLPEYAFIGRSNVGKSSLINMLVQQKGLAKTSQKPGKTQLINYFLLNDSFFIVDLPGYGFAKTSKEKRKAFNRYINEYIFENETLTNLFVLIDSRHEPQKIDLEFINKLGDKGIPFSLVFTKADKLSKTKLENNIAHYKDVLYESWESLPPLFITSSQKQIGRENILEYIGDINSNLSSFIID